MSSTSVIYAVGLGMSFDPWITISYKIGGIVIAVNSNRMV